MAVSEVGASPVYQTIASNKPAAVPVPSDGDRDDGVSSVPSAGTGVAARFMQQLGIGRNLDMQG